MLYISLTLLKTIIVVTLTMQLLSCLLISMVINRQLRLFSLSISQDIIHFRRLLFGLALVILASNFIPILYGGYLIYALDAAPAVVSTSALGLLYIVSFSTMSLVSSYLIWRLYREVEVKQRKR